MAVVANTQNTYDIKGIREELSDVIYNISPEDTVFLSNAGRGSVNHTFFEWQVDSLAAVDTANAVVEGDDVTSFAAATPTTRIGNYCQISRKTAIVSDTTESVDKAGRKSEMAYQLAKRSSELKRDMEAILLSNQGAVAGATAVARKTASLLAFIRSNTNIGATGANPAALTSGAPAAGRTDGTLRSVTEAMLKDVVQQAWTNGGSPDTVLVGATIKQAMSAFAGIATKTLDSSKVAPTAIIGSADVYVSDFGKLSIVPSRFQRSRDVFVMDFEFVSVDYLRKFKKVPLAKTGDADKVMLLAEYGLRVKNEAALALIADVQP